MTHALNLARRGLGQVWPNPAVGCVLVRNGIVLAEGWTQPGGRPHAEREALRRTTTDVAGATAYVTLEPCSHFGQTPPCAQALIDSGIRRVVIACGDPDPRVDGRGVCMLRSAGITVTEGICRDQALALNAGFFSRIQRHRPWLRLKIATTLDARIATVTGASQWITGPRARAEGHRLRSESDAVLTGGGTVNADNPLLTVRLPGYAERQPVRVILEGLHPVSDRAQIWQTTDVGPVWLVTARDDSEHEKFFPDHGVEVLRVAADSGGRPDLAEVMERLAAKGLTRVLLEAGATLNTAFLQAGLVDAVSWFRAASVIGGDGLPGIHGLGIQALEQTLKFQLVRSLRLDSDVLEDYQRAEGSGV